MNRRWRSALALGLVLGGQASAMPERLRPWLGNRAEVLRTEFCRVQACRLESTRLSRPSPVGSRNGTLSRYSLRGGWALEVDVRPSGWISAARLFLPAQAGPFVNTELRSLSPQGHRLAADFLTTLTGRRFSAGAVAACEARELAEYGRAPVDFQAVLGRPFSRWTTPAGLPYVARCYAVNEPGVGAGWGRG